MQFTTPRAKVTLATVVLLLLSWCHFAFADPQPDDALPPKVDIPQQLSLEEALRIFRAHGLDLLIAEISVESARADERIAGALPNPTINFSIGHAFAYNPNDPSQCPPGGGCSETAFSGGLSDSALWDVISGKRGLRLKVARAALSATRQSRLDIQRILEFQVKLEYLQAALAHRALEFTLEVQDTAQRTFELIQARYRAGAISEADVAKAEVAKLQAEQAVSLARQDLRIQQLQLVYLLGARSLVPELTLITDLFRKESRPALTGLTREALLNLALMHRPDLKALGAQRVRALASIELAQRQRVPDIALSLQFTSQGSGQNAIQPPTLSGGLTLALPILNQYQGDITKARADAHQQAVQYAKQEAQIFSDIESSYASLQGGQELVDRMESRLLERAKYAVDLVNFQYRRGATSLLEYLDARRTYIATMTDYFQGMERYWTAVFQVEQAVGVEYLH